MTLRTARSATISARLTWPYLRLRDARGFEVRGEIAERWLVYPDVRIPHKEAIRLMCESIEFEGNPARGLHAAALVEPNDREPVEFASRGAATIGHAFEHLSRWFPLLNDAADLTLERGDRTAAMVYRVTRGDAEPPAFADSVLANLLYFVRRNAVADESGWELHFAHPRPDYAHEYSRIFAGTIRFDRLRNALVLPEGHLMQPMLPHSPTIAHGYRRRADEMLARLGEPDSLSSHVRELVAKRLSSGQTSMAAVADELAVSVATLRRRLHQENTTFAALVDDVRYEIAATRLRDIRWGVGEVGFTLGFANVAAFSRAFKRWSGMLPSQYRSQERAKEARPEDAHPS